MTAQTESRDFGRQVYGLAGIALGILGLIFRDFAAVWQPIENLIGGADRKAIAIIYAAAFLIAGAATVWRKTAQTGVLVLAGLHLLSVLGWIPRIAGNWRIYGTWNGFFELFSIFIGGVIAYAALTNRDRTDSNRPLSLCDLFAVVRRGALHRTEGDGGLRPGSGCRRGKCSGRWRPGCSIGSPPSAIALNIKAALAARLVTVMMLGFAVLAWGPIVLGRPEHFT